MTWKTDHVQNRGYLHTREGTMVAASKNKEVHESGLAPSDCDEPSPTLPLPNMLPVSARGWISLTNYLDLHYTLISFFCHLKQDTIITSGPSVLPTSLWLPC